MADAPKKKSEDQEDYVDFPMPEGFAPPDDVKPGKEFQALATLKVDEDGDLCLIALDGAPVKPEGEEADEGAEDENKDQGMMDVMKQSLPATGIPA
jgi:hypothetical protein